MSHREQSEAYTTESLWTEELGSSWDEGDGPVALLLTYWLAQGLPRIRCFVLE